MNCSFENSIFPGACKKPIVSPNYKRGGDTDLLTDYRSIAIAINCKTPSFSKIFEKNIFVHVRSFFVYKYDVKLQSIWFYKRPIYRQCHLFVFK